MKVVYVRTPKTKGYLRVGVDTGEGVSDFYLSESEYSGLGSPLTGDSVSAALLSELSYLDMKYRARLRALRILSYGDNSRSALFLKLMRAGIKRDVAEEIADEMVGFGYIDSQRQLERLITNEVNLRNTGPGKLIPKLVSKGYSHSDIEEKISQLSDRGEISFEDAKKRLLAKLPPDSDREKIKKTLYKNGYSVCLNDL